MLRWFLSFVRRSRVPGLLIAALFAGAGLPSAAGAQASQLETLQDWTAKMVQLQRNGQTEGAIRLAKRIVDAASLHFGKEHLRYAESLSNLALLYELDHQPAKAEALYTKALAIISARFGPDDHRLAMTLNNLASATLAQCRFDETRAHYARALDLLLPVAGPRHPDVTMIRRNLTKIERLIGAAPDALKSPGHELKPFIPLRPGAKREKAGSQTASVLPSNCTA